jgi:hypothetical protein
MSACEGFLKELNLFSRTCGIRLTAFHSEDTKLTVLFPPILIKADLNDTK